MKVTDSETRWSKIGEITDLAILGKETIFFGKGCHLVFVNLNNGEELLYTANSSKNGDGIRCYVGHRTQNVFAFAENKTNPRVFVKAYPSFEDIYQLKDGDPRGYISMVFSESSLLLAIGDLPHFGLTVWNWRVGEKIAHQDGQILMADQVLKCNFGCPVFLAQLGRQTHQLQMWDIHLCGKKCVVTEHSVKIQQNCDSFSGILWTSEGGFFVLDEKGCIYTMFPDHHLEKVIDFSEPGNHRTSFAWFKLGLAVAGPNQEIRHYKKSGTWTIDWTLVPPQPIHSLMARFEYLVAVTTNFDILQVVPSQSDYKIVKQNESQFNDICLVNPVGKYLLALTRKQVVISMYKVATGELINSLDLEGKTVIMVSNPKFPYAAVGFESGIIKLISAYSTEKLVKMTQFFLTKHPADNIYFNECGTVFVVGNLTIGRFFIIEGLPGGHMDIIATVDTNCQIADYMMIVSQDCYRIFMIPVTSNSFIAGSIIRRYCVIKNKGIDIKDYTFDQDVLYKKITAISGTSRDRVFYLVPYEEKTITEAEVKKGDTLARVTRKILTGHQMRNFYFYLNKQFALTWGYDGFVIARSSDFGTNIGIALPHHRMEAGVKKAFLEPQGKYLVSLGHDGVLVCTDLMERPTDPQLEEELQQIHDSSDYKLLFSKHTVGYVPQGIYEGKCYLEVQEMKKLEKERLQCETERNSILEEFKSIQKELQQLLTENIEGPENEKLDLKEFNLNISLFEKKAAYHRKLRQATEVYLKNKIEAQNKISEYMIVNYWNNMKVPGTAIKGLFANFEVTNYVLRFPDANREDTLKWIRQQRRVERYLNEMNSFYPWEPIPESKLMDMVSQKPSLPTKDEEMKILSELELDVLEPEDQDNETKIAFSGSDLPRFIEVQEAHYLQNELQTYFQAELQWIISKSDSYKLKEHFNAMFDKVMVQKSKEMSNLKQKNERLRHIVSELNYFSEEKIQVRIDDPQWEQIENPELITKVKDDEVPITPYISPSEQALLDAKAAEAERLRLLLLADDFRERALMAMMNGVLEVRWEDELKKDVPLPKCMIEKEPEHYNEDDLRAVKDYEEKVQLLNSERERYKFLLRGEYAKLAHSVRENVKKFNAKLSELLNFKLFVDSAISQESLKINRMKHFQHSRKVMVKKEQEILQKIRVNDEVISSLQKLMHTLNESVTDCRNYVDSFQVKDKILEKSFKKDIQDMSLVIQEQATKLLRKRPKVNFRTINSATMLSELSKCILSNTKPPLTLNQDSLDFLKQLEQLDLYSGVPTIVDEHTYALICRHRRLRIEYEIKLKSAQNQLAEAESTSSIFHKRLQNKRELNLKLHNDLNEIRQELITVMCDVDVQIVLPRGLVEIPLSGSLEDFDDAVLICRKDVENINDIILRFGDNKIKALQQAMNFRRRILKMEWQHKRSKMLIQDLQEKLIDIESVRLTKEIQFYLKSKDKEKAIPFEMEVDMIKASYENTIQDRKDKVSRMKKQINGIKAHDEVVSKKIQELNVDVCELNLHKDHKLDDQERATIDARMKALLKRSKLVQQIQDNHHEILMLQTELELLRLKTFPTLKYKVY